jgi:Ser/Thr protein kinase RdoA (MazF antagonist)
MEADPHAYPEAALASRLKEGWGIAPESLIHVREGANNVFRASRGGGEVFIKVTAASIRTESEVSGSSAFLRHLGDKGAPVSKLVIKENGNRYDIFDHGERTYFITVTEAAAGTVFDKSCKDAGAFAAWGAALAQLHNGAQDFERTSFPYLAGDGEWLRITERCEDTAENIRQVVLEIAAWREALPRPSGGLPLTHGDMNIGNVIFKDGAAMLIDFDEPMINWNTADIARPFRETWDQSDEERAANFRAFLKAYERHRPLEFTDPEDYERFCTLKNLEMYGWFRKEWTGGDFIGNNVEASIKLLEDLILAPLKLG